MTTSSLAIHGLYRDVLRDEEGRVGYDSGWVSNTIVTHCRVLLASFLKNEPTAGIRYLAVGQGDAAWDADGVPTTNPETTTALVQAYGAPIDVTELVVAYLDSNNVEVQNPTANIQITATLGPDYPEPVVGLNTYPLREFGLFGALAGTPYMINSIRHPVIHKDAGSTLIRVVRLSF